MFSDAAVAAAAAAVALAALAAAWVLELSGLLLLLRLVAGLATGLLREEGQRYRVSLLLKW